jgi:hypothetical protein
VKPATIRRWAVIDYDHHREVANQFVKTLERNLTKLGKTNNLLTNKGFHHIIGMTIKSRPDFVSGNGHDIAGVNYIGITLTKSSTNLHVGCQEAY